MNEHLPKIIFYSKRLLNGLLFYVGWFVCVMSAANGIPGWAIFTTAGILIVHFILFENRLKDLVLLITMIALGFAFDTLYINLDWVRFHSPNRLFVWSAPLWIVGLHAIFATTVNHSLSWLKHKPLYSACLGASGIALTYLAGERMGAVDLLLPGYLTVVAIGIIWFFYLPLLYWYSLVLDKVFSSSEI